MPAAGLHWRPGGDAVHGRSDDRDRPAQKASHTAVAVSGPDALLAELRLRASGARAERLLDWAAVWPQRTWLVEGAVGLDHLLAQQLLSAGERVLDVQPKLGTRMPNWCCASEINQARKRPTEVEIPGVASPHSMIDNVLLRTLDRHRSRMPTVPLRDV